ncbi:hypothetical protein EFK50_21725 [Nocardioides marmoriginsengisoli]|uniref:LPXTG cell wall anchor domain-containing protein n=1 Tax=Nocardioides marmoriginsengisoli TaxID=661483 RepID=A0A3N0C960_9ACTN|nr:hypothetical protein [Nocardioides marmoriginsengisoli]RNL60008.1 hypothetical protein EFK50_21725 [Nocardioides marmoriginsengisoli]
MNRSIRTLIIAAPLAVAALTLTPGAALAADGPVIVAPVGGDPKPMDIAAPTPAPQPVPDGPGEVSNGKPKPTHPKPHHPQPNPDGPGGITDTPDCTHGCGGNDVPDDKAGPNPGNDKPGDDKPGTPDAGDEPDAGKNQGGATDSISIPTRVDAGAASADSPSENGLDLTWTLAGGALLVASGAAFAARKRQQA